MLYCQPTMTFLPAWTEKCSDDLNHSKSVLLDKAEKNLICSYILCNFDTLIVQFFFCRLTVLFCWIFRTKSVIFIPKLKGLDERLNY